MAATGRHGGRSGHTDGWWLGLGVSGAVMIALPLVLSEGSQSLPPMFHEDTEGYRELLDKSGAVDRAFATGNLNELRGLVTWTYLEHLRDSLRKSTGSSLNRKTMLDQGVHIGSLGDLRFLLGRSVGDRACAAYDMARPERDGGYPARRGVFALRFVWDGTAYRLDGKTARSLPPGQTAEELGQEMVSEMLGGK